MGTYFLTVALLLSQIEEGTVLSRVYIAGATDAGAGRIQCSPPEVGTSDMMPDIIAALKLAPASSNAAVVVLKAVARKWPCVPQKDT